MSLSDEAIRTYVKNSFEYGLFEPCKRKSELKVEDNVFTIRTSWIFMRVTFKVIPLEKGTEATAKAIEKFLNKPLPGTHKKSFKLFTKKGSYQILN
ncbi:hypothetical protein D5018_11860 [Parashewanella curva]|uniref:Uncharacterized protein n=1 Tax=Parashewanella curva TaxID=2338552 RepID=A0A3L8PVN7_9GAMM|nr:hypothetical protein [Parashewanella curva]RLV59475.1 hypothetical protein D5018_11860 [Parashewanella curva]